VLLPGLAIVTALAGPLIAGISLTVSSTASSRELRA
jgi:hypothetical protein